MVQFHKDDQWRWTFDFEELASITSEDFARSVESRLNRDFVRTLDVQIELNGDAYKALDVELHTIDTGVFIYIYTLQGVETKFCKEDGTCKNGFMGYSVMQKFLENAQRLRAL